MMWFEHKSYVTVVLLYVELHHDAGHCPSVKYLRFSVGLKRIWVRTGPTSQDA
jgi:hypothetical protein